MTALRFRTGGDIRHPRPPFGGHWIQRWVSRVIRNNEHCWWWTPEELTCLNIISLQLIPVSVSSYMCARNTTDCKDLRYNLDLFINLSPSRLVPVFSVWTRCFATCAFITTVAVQVYIVWTLKILDQIAFKRRKHVLWWLLLYPSLSLALPTPTLLLYPSLSLALPIPKSGFTHPTLLLYPSLSLALPIPHSCLIHPSLLLYPSLSLLLAISNSCFTHP